MSHGKLVDKVALITGSSQGIGRATALAMAREGADIVVNGRPPQRATEASAAEQTAREIVALGRRALVCHADVGDRDQVVGMFEQAVAHFGAIDIAVANAALNVKQPIVKAGWEDVQRIVNVCLYGVFHTCQLAAQQMIRQNRAGRRGGKILINGSVHADIAVKCHGVYSMCKSASKQLCRVLAVELAAHRINVNSVNPGWIDTPNERTFITEEQLQAAAQKLPWKRLGTPEEIAAAFVFLASAEADYISGQTLVVDGALELDFGPLVSGLDAD
jgi:glucose 1-dehydrogenase